MAGVQGIVMCTVGGLRGALCLIMVQTVVLDIGADGGGGTGTSTQLSAVKGALAFWTAGVVLGTLLINAPALTFVLRVTGLTNVSLLTLQTRDKARRQFTRYTADCVLELQKDEDELLQGALRCAALPPFLLQPKSVSRHLDVLTCRCGHTHAWPPRLRI